MMVWGGRVADEVDEFLVDDAEDVVARARPRWGVLLERPGLDAVRQVHHEADVDVGLQERPLDLLDDLLDVLLGEPGLAAERLHRPPEGAPEVVEYHLAPVGQPAGKGFVRGDGAVRHRGGPPGRRGPSPRRSPRTARSVTAAVPQDGAGALTGTGTGRHSRRLANGAE
jgi:hypothetical protein